MNITTLPPHNAIISPRIMAKTEKTVDQLLNSISQQPIIL
jgi:hypothetical protein